MELRELKERLEIIKDCKDYYFNCFDIHCEECIFYNHLEVSCGGMLKDYNWDKIKELDLPDNTIVTKELLKEFRKDS